MNQIRSRRRALTMAIAPLFLASLAVSQDAERDFHAAYYLEHEEGDFERAHELYAAVAAGHSGSVELRAKAGLAAESLTEELIAGDMARLMPHDTLVFVELGSPGAKFEELLGKLGLLADGRPGEGARVSPLLIQNLLGLRGAAIAVTGIDLGRQEPRGVLVLHPGDMDLARGFIDTVIPTGGRSVQDIGGHPTWALEDEAYLTLTHRLVIAARERSAIVDVVERLQGGKKASLADNEIFAEALDERGALFSFCVNPKPLFPLAQIMLHQAAKDEPELGMALQLLDIQSLRSLAGSLDLDGDGLDLEVALGLDEGHRNLAFNFLRMPHVDDATLKAVPGGSAFFFAASLNPTGSASPLLTDGAGRPIVTLFDFGRELFSNLADVALYGMPSARTDAGIPNVAAVLRVNDPARSQAVWSFVLGLASQATGGSVDPASREIAGLKADVFEIEGHAVLLAVDGNRVILTPSEAALAASLGAGAGQGSVTEDAIFAQSLSKLDRGATWLAMASLGRSIAFARAFAPEDEAREMAAFEGLLDQTSLALGVEHSANRFRLRARLAGLPDVSGLVARLIEEERQRDRSVVHHAPGSAPEVAAHSETAEHYVGESPQAIFARLAGPAPDAARALAAEFLANAVDAKELNNFAWALLTEKIYGNTFDDVALEVAQRANELAEYGNWYYLDTLALAVHRNGELDKAIKLQEMAVELAEALGEGDGARVALIRYRAEADKALAGAIQ